MATVLTLRLPTPGVTLEKRQILCETESWWKKSLGRPARIASTSAGRASIRHELATDVATGATAGSRFASISFVRRSPNPALVEANHHGGNYRIQRVRPSALLPGQRRARAARFAG